jgi:hypothetical protein
MIMTQTWSRKLLNVAPIPGISVTSVANHWKEIAIMIKIKFISKLALTLAAGGLSAGMLGVDASAQAPMPLITVIIGDR